jgi:hypothetical protein
LLKRSSITTLPQVFDTKGNLIGGYTEMKTLLEEDDR